MFTIASDIRQKFDVSILNDGILELLYTYIYTYI